MKNLSKGPHTTSVDRAELRRDQAAVLRKAVGKNVIVVRGRTEEDEKYIVGKQYFEELLRQFQSALETLSITTDVRLFSNLLKASETINDDLKQGKLYSFDEAFE